ncbi:hypothetical protein [Yoonia maritima]|uniref:hypothetical protein n=1 Tax=Yoonia maritima TaxID=1435347 RepID=UPI000D10A507|nr:hypothetical protein [Yoonia maritima]
MDKESGKLRNKIKLVSFQKIGFDTADKDQHCERIRGDPLAGCHTVRLPAECGDTWLDAQNLRENSFSY